MTRRLSTKEIEDILDFIVPQEDIPIDTALSVVNIHKDRFRKQLVTQLVYPAIISQLKECIKKTFHESLIQAGESVGVICAQSIGEKNTQCTLNSIDWSDKILYIKDEGIASVTEIGKFIDGLLDKAPIGAIQHIEENRTEYLTIPIGYAIPSTDADGMVKWYRIEAVTRHLPVGKLVKVTTQSGRSVTATQAKSFLVWNGEKFEGILGSDIKVGDIIPTTCHLERYDWYGMREYMNRIVMDDDDFGFFIGLYIAEGWRTSAGIGFSTKDENARKRLSKFCDRYKESFDITVSTILNLDFKIFSESLSGLFKDICNTGSRNRFVPDFAYSAPDDFVKGLLDGYFSSADRMVAPHHILMYKSITEPLTYGIASLLLYLGIFCEISKNNDLIMKGDYAQKFAQEFPHLYRVDKKGKKVNDFPVGKNNVYFDRIVSVELVDGTTNYVYDLTVETTRNFQLWNGINVMDTFHKAGQSEKTMTAGVPRFQELLNATKKPRIVNHKIYFKEGNETIEQIRDTVGHQIVGLTFSDISLSVNVCLNKSQESWYNAYNLLYNTAGVEYPHCISLKLNMNKLFEFKLTMRDIATYIHSEYDDLSCVFSPPQIGQFDVFVDTSNIELPLERILFVDSENATEIYLEECVQPILETMNICGIRGITEVFYAQENSKWFVETNGINSRTLSTQYINYKVLLALEDIDFTRTISNNVWDIYEVLGIEAARAFLVDEFMAIMEGINTCHAGLLVDRMTHCGIISSITRYTMKKDESGPFGRASFEETMDNFINAAMRGEIEPTEGVSAAIICGKRAAIGTGLVDLRLDLDRLPY